MIVSDPAITAGLVAISIGLVEVIKQFIFWMTKRGKGKDTILLQLDPEASKLIHDTDSKTTEIKAIVGRTDADGTPLVYSDRSVGRSVERLGEVMKELAESQQRLADSMARLDARFEAHDRSDAITFSRLVDAQERLEAIANSNKDSLLEVKKDNESSRSKMDQIIQTMKK